jgi:UDP-N-acetylmuramoyl-tripeptide--D-alanyl-D-alanine ligase
MAVGGKLVGSSGRLYTGVSTDTRDALAGQLFVALVGDKHDAHDHLSAAWSGGAAGVLVSEAGWARVGGTVSADRTAIVVKDTLHALGELARFHHRRLGTPVLALTGSNGKTSTKELLHAILSVSRRTLKTEGNLNNLIGVPMTLLGLGAEHQLAVVEMGMNTPGEIDRYAEIAEPIVGMVINVGPAHIGELGSIEAVAKAKGELFRRLGKDAIAIANLDDPRVMGEAQSTRAKVRTFGRDAKADVRLVASEPILTPEGLDGGQWLTLAIAGKTIQASIPFAGAHNAMNAAGAVAAATALQGSLQVELDDIVTGLPRALNVGRRLAFKPVGKFLVVDDAYNANSASMIAAIETVAAFGKKSGRRVVAVLGEMRELGQYGPEEHRTVGMALKSAGDSLVAAFGPMAGPITDAAKSPGVDALHEADDLDALWRWLRPRLSAGDLILVKGSRGARMERMIPLLEGEGA